MSNQIQYLIKNYRGAKLQWQISKPSLSALARFILASEPYRAQGLGDNSIIIEKAYVNFPSHNQVLESFATNNADIVQTLANEV